MLNAEYVIPCIMNVNGELVLDINKGYVFSNDDIIGCKLEKIEYFINRGDYYIQVIEDNNDFKLVGAFSLDRDKDTINAMLFYVFLYINGEIYLINRYNIFGNIKDDYIRSKGILDMLFNLVKQKDYLLDYILDFLGLKILYIRGNDLFLVDNSYDDSKDASLGYCYLYNKLEGLTRIMQFNRKKMLELMSRYNYYVVQDLGNYTIYLVKVADSITFTEITKQEELLEIWDIKHMFIYLKGNKLYLCINMYNKVYLGEL